MKNFSRILASVILVIMLLTTVSFASSTPYETYTYSSTGFVLNSPDAYVPDRTIDYTYMGLDSELQAPTDIEVDAAGNLYIADAGNNRIVILDKYYKLKTILSSFVNDNGVQDSFSNPQGVFINDKNIFVCDTDNHRIVIFDLNYNFVNSIGKPESTLFEDDDPYCPVAVAVDTFGRLFVVSNTTLNGIVVINDDGSFTGFIGAQKVTVSALDLIWQSFQSEEQKAQQAENVSIPFNNITVDEDGFLYATITINEQDQQAAMDSQDMTDAYAPVKKLNASGSDVMRRNGFYPPSGEVVVSTVGTEITGASRIVDAAVGPERTWSIIDSKRSKVYTYDKDGNLLFIFGDVGTQVGNITKDGLAGIVYQGDNLILLDKLDNSFTVYRRTEYGDTLISALMHENTRQYDLSVDDWYEILKRNNNYDKAYIGIGEALYRSGEYDEALEFYQAASDTEGYSKAFKEIRKEWANKWFWTIPIIIVVVLVLLVKFLGYANKVNKKVALKVGRKSVKEEVLYAFHLIVHPFDGFWDLKHEKRGSVRSGVIIFVIAVLSIFYQSVSTGYIFTGKTSLQVTGSILTSFLSVGLPFFLWIIANWCLTTLFEGEGKLKDIFVASAYSLTPIPLLIIPEVLLSNILIANESGILTLLTALAYVWVGLLLFTGTMTTHDYSAGKNILTILGTIVGMAFIMFIGILFSTLVGKMVSFISGIIEEIAFRL